ncbi:MAG TPA: hypothetical protein VFX76_16285, partial [Roseiflexaceae bacterium]|nr:hypothetical protein [Roseiflexaceae bacterium]
MRGFRTSLLALAVVLLTACSLPGLSSEPTPPPIIIIASPTPQGAAAQPTVGAPAAQPTAGAQATNPPIAQPTAAPAPTSAGPAPTVPGGSASKGTLTFAFDAFPTYYPGIVVDVKK